jgi:RimJ/RimL family protein N-acetyltransferase
MTTPTSSSPDHSAASAWAKWVPIRELRPRHSARIQSHLLSLSDDDRYLRFGYPATDEQIDRYVQGLRFGHDQLLGVFNRRLQLIAVAHLAFSTQVQAFHQAEFGVSVMPHARNRGYGARLFARAIVDARNQGVTHLVVHALTENLPMLKIAQRAGATIERHGSESEALLRLPPADFDSHVSELFQEQAALVDYHFKSRVHGWLGLRRLWRWWLLWRRDKNR